MSILDGKTAIITGGGQGIGRAYSLAFAQEGANVVVADLDGANAEAVAGEIAAAGGSAISVQADVGDPASVEGMAAAAREAFGGTDVLLNNAAIFTRLGRCGFEDIPLEEWDRVMRVNVTGGMLCAAAVLPDMRAKKQGRIINVSSSTVPMGLPWFMHYVTSKSAVIGMTRVMARELGPDGITANAIMPGLIETEAENPGRTDAIRARVIDLQCVKELGTPGDLTGLAVFLASDASGYITGQTIAADGGSVHL